MLTVNCAGMDVRSKLNEALDALHQAFVCARSAKNLLIVGDDGDEAPGAVREAIRQAKRAESALALALAGGGVTREEDRCPWCGADLPGCGEAGGC